MNLTDLLADLSARRVRVWAEEGQLRLRAPKDVVTPALKAALSEHKAELLVLLGEQSAGLHQTKPLEPRHAGGPAPLSFMQERLWFLWQMYPNSAVYNLPNARRMRGPLDPELLQDAFGEVVRRHEVLRSTFITLDGVAEQRAASNVDIDFELVDLTQVADPEAQADAMAKAEAGRPFDLEEGPLVRAKLFRLADDDHLFFWALHHIVSDGWSSILFLRELQTLYEAKRTGTPAADLTEPTLQFADFAAWERDWLTGDVLEHQLGYWREKLSGEMPVLELPADHRRPALLSYRGDCSGFSLSAELTARLRQVGVQSGTTLYVVLLTALKIFLHRYTGLKDICVGSPVARRNRPEIEDMIGCFINTLALRANLEGDPTVEDLLGRVRQTCTDAFRHQDTPFEKLIEELKPTWDTSHTPFFQVMFILHVQDTRKVSRIGEVAIEAVEYHAPTSKFDLTLELKETEGGLEGWFEYSSDLFEPSTVSRMVEQFKTLLEGIVHAADTRVSKLPFLPSSERRLLLQEWNDTATELPSDAGVHDLIAEWAARAPNSVAVEAGSTRLTYGELETRSNSIARYLQSLGVERGARVGLCMERSPDMITGLLGIMKLGAAYVPLDPSFPGDRLSFMAQDAGISVLVTESGLRGLVPDSQAQSVELDTDWPRIGASSGAPLESAAEPDDLAYVIYTSGSTGQPKGVMIEHRSLVNFLVSMTVRPGFAATDRMLAVTTLSFDIAGLELYLPLIQGGTVVLASQLEAADGSRLTELIQQQRISVMQATPSTWRMMLDAGWEGDDQLKVLCGGEAMPEELAEQLLPRSAELWNLYGPTETTIWSTVHRVQAGESPILVGEPIGNTTLYVLDEAGGPVPIGAQGELCIGGLGVARGYLGREALTDERFVSSPFQGDLDGRLYRTGDVARWRSNGSLQLMGRLDHQVKVRGFRIELGEIESVLTSHSGVAQASVVPKEYGPDDQRLVAYYVPDGEELDASKLRAHVKQKLPDYMVPAAYVALDEFPLTPNGKVDRGALPLPDSAGSAGAPVHVAPRTPTEELVASVWAEVLRVDRVSIHDSFFDLGGHSLLMTKVSSRLADSLGVQVSLVAMFERPTVAGLTEHILSQQLAQSGDDELSRMLEELERS